LVVIRRFLAIVLVPVFFALFLVTLISFRVNDTLLEPAFYTSTLERLDFYNFLHDEGIPLALDESSGGVADGLVSLGLTPDQVAGYAKRIAPPDWLEENVSGAVGQALPYFTGEADEFSITLRLDERVEAATEVARDLLVEARIHDFLLEEVIRPELDENRVQVLEQLPYNVDLTTDEVLAGVRVVVPEAWFNDAITSVLDEVTPYLTGAADSFRVEIALRERAQAGLGVVEGWLLPSLDHGAYEYLLDEQIAPVVVEALGSGAELPYGVTITNHEVMEAIGQVLPPDWVKERVTEAVAVVGPYMTGQTDSFVVSFNLEDRASLAVEMLVDTADAKLAAVWEALPLCGEIPDLAGLSLSLTEPPPCRPSLVTYEQLKAVVGLNVLDELAAAVVDPLPKTVDIDQDELFATLGTTDDASFDTVRELLRDGWVFTDADLRDRIREQAGDDALGAFDDLRLWLSEGFTYTDQDLRVSFAEANSNIDLNTGTVIGSADLDTFDRARRQVDNVRSRLFYLFGSPILLAIFIGFLGGRRWGSRLIWAAWPVVIAGGVIGGAFRVFSSGIGVIDAAVDERTTVLVDAIAPNAAIASKLVEVRDELIVSFTRPMSDQGLIAAGVGVVLMALGTLLLRRRPRSMRRPQQPTRPWETAEGAHAKGMVDDLRGETED
jgi:hypothetical protein